MKPPFFTVLPAFFHIPGEIVKRRRRPYFSAFYAVLWYRLVSRLIKKSYRIATRIAADYVHI